MCLYFVCEDHYSGYIWRYSEKNSAVTGIVCYIVGFLSSSLVLDRSENDQCQMINDNPNEFKFHNPSSDLQVLRVLYAYAKCYCLQVLAKSSKMIPGE